MAMQQIASLLTLILLLAAADVSLAVSTPSTIIRTTCAVLDRPGGFGYDECVDSLAADPASASAKDVRELAVVTTNLTVANVTSMLLVLDDLAKNLGWCRRIYRGMNKSLEAALGELRAGHLDAASHILFDATHAPDDCEILLFQVSAGKNPIRKENIDADWLSGLAYAIASLQLPNHPPHRRQV
ncbi:pectinesterase inhibitor 12-like [Triticum dicoccoides]|uniref:pectinesterase inhibitor 12-like n=1 Tax=Triticum dicoccoides TaxID=85692 RepID=UPI001890F72C|nr:pectinesterase inhibitor 12-like [Triticum dicoccoides]